MVGTTLKSVRWWLVVSQFYTFQRKIFDGRRSIKIWETIVKKSDIVFRIKIGQRFPPLQWCPVHARNPIIWITKSFFGIIAQSTLLKFFSVTLPTVTHRFCKQHPTTATSHHVAIGSKESSSIGSRFAIGSFHCVHSRFCCRAWFEFTAQ